MLWAQVPPNQLPIVCLEKLHSIDQIPPCMGIQLSPSSGSKIEPLGQVELDINLGKLKPHIHSVHTSYMMPHFRT